MLALGIKGLHRRTNSLHHNTLHHLIITPHSTHSKEMVAAFTFPFYYFASVRAANQLYTQAKLDPSYHKFINKISDEVMLICYDNNPNELIRIYRIPESLDGDLVLRMLKKALRRKEISLGLSINIRMGMMKRTIYCRIPPHRVQHFYHSRSF